MNDTIQYVTHKCYLRTFCFETSSVKQQKKTGRKGNQTMTPQEGK